MTTHRHSGRTHTDNQPDWKFDIRNPEHELSCWCASTEVAQDGSLIIYPEDGGPGCEKHSDRESKDGRSQQ